MLALEWPGVSLAGRSPRSDLVGMEWLDVSVAGPSPRSDLAAACSNYKQAWVALQDL